jgi:hypothetical protein
MRTLGASRHQTVLLYAMLAGLILLIWLLGSHGLAITRDLFLVASIGLGYVTWRMGAGRHLEAAVVLFAVTPFLRRVVDYATGYDERGLMLSGPLLFLLVPVVLDLPQLLLHRRNALRGVLAPYVLMLLCLAYGMAISGFAGSFLGPAVKALKAVAVLLYGVWCMARLERGDDLLSGAVRSFLTITPVIAIYSVAQYLDPSAADMYWMIQSKMEVIGRPEPRGVRVFGTMNSPASLGTFLLCGLLICSFMRRSWRTVVLCLPIVLALMLTMYRTSWIGLIVGVGYCLFFATTRISAMRVATVVAVSATVVMVATPFRETLLQRVQTLQSAPTEDGSGSARIDQLVTTYGDVEDNLVGSGFSPPLHGIMASVEQAADGILVSSVRTMGLIVGNVYIVLVVWAGAQGLIRISRYAPVPYIVAGAITASLIFQLPLSDLASGEVGFLYWVFIALAVGSGFDDHSTNRITAVSYPARKYRSLGAPVPVRSGLPK